GLGGQAPVSARWMQTKDAAAYLGWNRSALYSRAARGEIPVYRVDRMLLFRRDELDAWMENHRREAVDAPEFDLARSVIGVEQAEQQRARRPSAQTSGTVAKTRKRRERPLPPPIGGTEQDKDRWAQQ